MKILIIGFTKLKFMPYLRFYTEDASHAENTHILYWNRDLQDEDTVEFSSYTLHEFKCFQKDEVSKVSKIGSFIKFRKFALKTIKEVCPDKIIVMHTLPAVLISDILCKKYAGKFILDYRDYTFENVKLFKDRVGRLAEKSYLTFVSSDAYREFLPKLDKIYTTHNLSEKLLENKKYPRNSAGRPLKISFWGYIRQEEINKALIERIGNSCDFELHYYGREQETAENLKSFANDRKYSNVFFHGEYTPNERFVFASETDILDNVYFDKNSLMAMGNKFYDGLAFHLPQVFMEGSYMGAVAEKRGVGVVLNPNDPDFCEKLSKWFYSINREEFNKSCDELLEKIANEYENAKKHLTNFCVK